MHKFGGLGSFDGHILTEATDPPRVRGQPIACREDLEIQEDWVMRLNADGPTQKSGGAGVRRLVEVRRLRRGPVEHQWVE
jgi:hypothetical protein